MAHFYGPPIPGSISPVPATDDMTQPVGIRDGQLWTEGPDGDLTDRVAALEETVGDVTEQLSTIGPEVEQHDADIDDLQDRMDTAESNISQNTFDISQAQGDITGLGTQVAGKLDKPENTGDVGDVIVKTATGTEYQPVAPFNPNGTYPGVTVGTAVSAKSLENVSEDSGASQDEPFFFQATATANNTAETPTAPTFELKALRGNTIVYNQLVDGVNLTYATISGHKYWVYISATDYTSIITSAGSSITVSDAQKDKIVDITRWFNNSIPQAILDNPTIFPINYYDGVLTYSAGELKNCSCTELVTIGFNQFDKSTGTEWLNVYPSAGAVKYHASCKSVVIRCLPNTKYYFGKTLGGRLDCVAFDHIPQIGDTYSRSATSVVFGKSAYYTTDSTEKYLLVWFYNSNIDTGLTAQQVADTLCVNLSWDGERDGTYEPYTSHTYPIVWSGKSAGTAYDEKLPDGTEITRIGSVDLGSLSWSVYTADTSGHSFYCSLPSGAKPASTNNDIPNFICGYIPVGFGAINTFVQKDKVITFVIGPDRIVIRDSDYSSASDFATAMSGVILYYELETPTTSSGDAYTSVIEGDDYGTMSFDSVVPVGNEFFYPADYTLLIDDLGNYTDYDVTKLMLKTDLPTIPTSDGHYQLAVEVTGGVPTLYWEVVS